MPTTAELTTLAQQKARDFVQQPHLAALTLTGSLPRGMVWEGSDLDMWGFSNNATSGFEDGVISGIYWEIDIVPLEWLRQSVDRDALLRPPSLVNDEDKVTPLEVLWGCRIVYDHEGTLTDVAEQIAALMADHAWLRLRADRFLSRGYDALDALTGTDALTTIIKARAIATAHGIAAYWMKRGQLLTSIRRVPERLADAPEIQAVYRDIYGLEGATSAREFQTRWKQLPTDIQRAANNDLHYEVLPMFRLGYYDGGLRYFLETLPEIFGAERVRPVLHLEQDLEAQQARLIKQTRHLLDLISAL
jgi:hypothetical protein